MSGKRRRTSSPASIDLRLTRRRFLSGAAAAAAGLLLPTGVSARPASRARRNVLLVIIGRERSWDLLPGGLAVPARERIQQRAVEFKNFYCASPTPAPALAALLTGEHGPNNGVTNAPGIPLVGTSLPTDQPTLADVMRDGGWHTSYFGPWSLSEPSGPRSRSDLLDDFGFSWSTLPAIDSNPELADRLTIRSAATWLTSRAPTLTQPWLATVYLQGLAGVGEHSAQHASARYARAIEASDQRLGELLDALLASGERSNTVIVYTSDCGAVLGDRHRSDTGSLALEEVVNVPLLIDHPDGPGAVGTDALVSAVDVMPTILAMVNVPQKVRVDAPGYSVMRNVFTPGAKSPRERAGGGVLLTHSALSHHGQGGVAALLSALRSEERSLYRAIVTGRYKLVRHFAPTAHAAARGMERLDRHHDVDLYNLERESGARRKMAAADQANRSLVKRLNGDLNALVAKELGSDDGSYLPGPAFLWRS